MPALKALPGTNLSQYFLIKKMRNSKMETFTNTNAYHTFYFL